MNINYIRFLKDAESCFYDQRDFTINVLSKHKRVLLSVRNYKRR